MSPAGAALYQILARLFARGKPCPTNAVLGKQLEISAQVVAGRLRYLVEHGHVKVEVFGRGRTIQRQVTITRTGIATRRPEDVAPEPARAPWIDTRPPRVVERHACFWCGTRSDIGCRHTRGR